MSIYFLHIPRTSGVYVNHNVLPYLISKNIEHFVSNRSHIDIQKIQNSQFVSGHFGRMPIEYMDNPTVYSIVRNPIERYISYFKYTTGVIRSKSEIYKKLDSWLYGEKSEINANMQSKFLTGKININNFNLDLNVKNNQNDNYRYLAVNNGWYIENYNLNFSEIKKNIENINIYTLNNNNNFKKKFNDELNKQFGFQTFKLNNKDNSSFNIGIDFTKKQLNKIEELNQVDMELYEYVQKIEKEY